MWAIFGYIDTIDAPIHSSKIKNRIKKVEEEIGKDTHKERKKEETTFNQPESKSIKTLFSGARGGCKTTTRAAQLNDATY